MKRGRPNGTHSKNYQIKGTYMKQNQIGISKMLKKKRLKMFHIFISKEIFHSPISKESSVSKKRSEAKKCYVQQKHLDPKYHRKETEVKLNKLNA